MRTPILTTMQEEVKKKEIEELVVGRDELIKQRNRTEDKIKALEKRRIDDKITSSLRKLEDVSDAVADIQNGLNIVWKRINQIEEELKETLNEPILPSTPHPHLQ